MSWPAHISDDDLERYCIGMVREEEELRLLEGHILACPSCAERAEQTRLCVAASRAGLADFVRARRNSPIAHSPRFCR